MSNALEAASLIMVPSGYENGTLASVKPNDGTGDFTFSRGSNLSATRINEQGYIEKGYENLLLQSNQFDTTWTNFLIDTPTSGQAGYDGTNNAWLIECINTSNFNGVRQSISTTGVTTLSVYAKAGTTNFLGFFSSAGFGGFELIGAGTTGQLFGNAIDSKIELISNGWYRCSIVLNGNVSAIFIGARSSINSFNANIGDSVYIQDAMLNQGLVAYPYIETTTASVAGGILEDMPRLDWASGAPSLLLEPSRTNLITYSEFTDVTGVWFDSGATIDHNTEDTLSPEGYYNALKYNSPIATGSFYYSGMPVSQNTEYTFTFYVKKGTNENTRLAVYDETNLSFIDVDVPYTASTEEWTRIKHTFTTPVNCTSARVYPQRFNSAGTIYFYGFQVEQDATYPTSYIPTYGVSQTRLEDDIKHLTGVGVTGDEFSIFLELDLSNTPLVSNLGIYFQTFDSSNNSQQEFRFFTFGGEQVLVPYFRQDFTYAFGNGSNAVRFDGKILFRADGGGSYTMFFGFNGSSTKEIRTGLTAYTLNKIDFISRPKTNLKQLLIFNKALSDEECIQLTTV